jgi:hypothetical protein
MLHIICQFVFENICFFASENICFFASECSSRILCQFVFERLQKRRPIEVLVIRTSLSMLTIGAFEGINDFRCF